MSNRPPYETFTKPTCRGSYALGTACGKCEKCEWENTHRLDKAAKNFGLKPAEHEKLCSYENVVNFILWELDDKHEAYELLDCWSRGDFNEWPEYKKFVMGEKHVH